MLARRLLVNGVDAGRCEVTETRGERRRGLLGRRVIDGSMLLTPCRSVHTLGMSAAIDVAHLRRVGPDAFTVIRTRTMARGRVGLPVWGAAAVLEASADAFARWELRTGSPVAVRP